MASITQQIPNYKSGISELPDELKYPGQVVDLNNGIPDISRGLIKRPGTDLVKVITPATTGKWFPIYRDDGEQYIGQVATTGAVKVWRCSDGVEIPIDYAAIPGTNLAEYLIHTNSDEIQPFTINETTFFTNRKKVVAMKTDSADKSPAIANEAYIALRSITYGKQYALDIFDPDNHTTVTYNRATSIEADEDVDTSGIAGYSNDGKCEGMAKYTVTAADTDKGTSYMLGGTGKSNLRYEMDARCTPVPQPGSVSSAYDDSYQPNAILQFGGEGWKTNDTHTYTSIKGLETQVKVTNHISITARANVGLIRPESTSSNAAENVSAESILAGMKNAIDSIPDTGITTTIAGNGIHLYRSTPFNVTTSETQLMDIITSDANTPDDLPRTCRHGYIVKVINSGEDQDDYYLKFKVNNIDENNSITGVYTRTASSAQSANYTRGSSNTIATSAVNTSNDTITITAHGFTTGTSLLYDDASGTVLTGLTDNTTYYAIIVDEDTIKLATSSGNATAGTAINLTGAGNNSQTLATALNTVTITDTAHGLVTGDQIVATFSGAATDGTYTIANVKENTFDVTDAAAGIITSTSLTYTHGIATFTKTAHGLATTDSVIVDFKSGNATDGWHEIGTVPSADTLTLRQDVPTNIGGTVATSAVNTSTETITLTAHNFSTGDEVHYSNGGGTTLAGLTDDTIYYCIKTDANNFKLATTKANADASTAIDLTGTGNNSQVFSATAELTPNRFGTGVWEECAGPNLEIAFDPDTMPLNLTRVLPSTQHTIATSAVNTSNEQITITGHGLSTGDTLLYDNGGGTTLAGLTDDTIYYAINAGVNTIALASSLSNANAGVAVNLTGTGNNAQTLTNGYFSINGGSNAAYTNGAFRFGYPAWDERGVGDDITNPKPSFVGSTINKIFFFRNRIGLLSEENVILSRTNDFYNFWAKTAFTIANADPIDLQSSSTYPTELFDAVEVNAGLLVFSASQQFLLKTDETQLTPETAIISFLSSYAFNEKTHPISLGTSAGWLNSTAKRTRFHEMAGIQRNGEPQVLEQTKLISKLFPDDITLLAESVENQMVLFGTENNKEVWGYKFYTQGEQRVQDAWFRWELPGTVTYHVSMDDTYYAVIKNSSTYTLEAIDIKKATDTLSVGTAPSEYLVHLDTKSLIASGSLSYSATTNKTSFTKPDGYNSSQQLAVFCHTSGNNIGKYGEATVASTNIEFEGDWTGQDIILGYLYEFEVELPTIYIQQSGEGQVKSETRGSLVVHRVNLTFGSVGLIETTLKRTGRSDYSKTYESIEWDNYLASKIGITDDYIHTIPVYDRNTNLSLHLKSSHPAPATLHSMTWEGDYNPKYYRRV